MKIWTGILLACALTPALTGAQQKAIPEFDKLRTPSSPAFVILGLSPTRIQRPNTPATVAASFLEDFGNPGGLLPNAYAIEVAPYWLFPHPTLTLDTYARGGPATFVRNFTVSIGTSDSTAANGSGRRMLSAGLRTMLVSARDTAANSSNPCIAEAQHAAAQLSRLVGAAVTAFVLKNPTAPEAVIDSVRKAAFEKAQAEAPPEVRRQIEATTTNCVGVLSVNRGFILDAAGAAAWSFGDGTWETGRTARLGLWLTPAYQFGAGYSVVGIASGAFQGLDADTTASVVDLGVRGIFAFKSVAVSAEGIARRLGGDVQRDWLFRLDLGFDVMLREGVWLTTTFGRDFNAAQARSVLALANIQWSIGDRSINPTR
ncbi:MAG: hypothetical protein ACRENP_14810 [Longimicrobiales bacterium]